ncbi:MAG: hypothetical protein H6629_21550 [Calditrichae bacterium]|nr:hypothetical protein [Calditrichia bacterium]
MATTGNDYYVDATESGVSLNPQVNNIEIKYKLKAVDLANNKSAYSSEVTFNQSGGGLDKKRQPKRRCFANSVCPGAKLPESV